ncbi:MAG TPA: hypothetical protein VFT70_00355 [Nocardioides sp.]|nr:hypothetical protein [Nocardioides sp.]
MGATRSVGHVVGTGVDADAQHDLDEGGLGSGAIGELYRPE